MSNPEGWPYRFRRVFAQVLAAQVLSVTGLTDSADPQVTHKRLYRTLNAGGLFLVDQDVAVGTTIATSSQSDSALGAQLALDNDVPPNAYKAVEFQGTMFLLGDAAHPNYLWFSKHFVPEAVPAANFLIIGGGQDPLITMVSALGQLGVFSAKTKWRIVGNNTSGYTYLEAVSKRGTFTERGAIGTDQGTLFVARDGLFLTTMLQQDAMLSSDIEPLWYGLRQNDYPPIDFARANEMALGSWKQRFYFSYPTTDNTNVMAVFSRETNHWYFYQYNEPVTAMREESTTGLFLAGTRTGILASLEIPSVGDETGNIAYTLEGKDRAFGDTMARHLVQWCRVDVDATAGSVLFELLIDGVVRYRRAITGNRTRRLFPVPDNLMGFTWRPRWTFSGTGQMGVYGCEVYARDLAGA